MTLAAGTKLGPYEILAPIGAGGMGEVYRARDPRLGREVAIKVLPASFSQDADRLKRFEQEARAAGVLNHPNITAVHDFGTADGAPYIVTELLEGETLRSRLGAGAISARKSIDYAIQLAKGLAAAHEKGIVHRDLKPENIFLTKDGRLKILDFGLAKLKTETGEDGKTDMQTVSGGTQPGVVLGTMGYMAPEQVRGRAADKRSDLFAFGTLLYEMVSGQRAFRGDSAADTITAILTKDPPDLSQTNKEIHPGLDRIVRHCLEKNPEERFESARDVAFDLESLSGVSAPTGAVAAASVPPRRRWLAPALISASVALAAGLAAGYAFGKKTGYVPPPNYQQLTFRRGEIYAARFAPDGQTVVYAAAWDGNPVELFVDADGSPESRVFGLVGADLLAISKTGEMVVSLDRHIDGPFTRSGTLAEVGVSGGVAPREILKDVQWADWGPNGKDLAVVRDVSLRSQLEYPVGRVLYQTAGWISHPRVSPDGALVAFLDHPHRGDDGGQVAVVDRTGKKTALGGGFASESGSGVVAEGRRDMGQRGEGRCQSSRPCPHALREGTSHRPRHAKPDAAGCGAGWTSAHGARLAAHRNPGGRAGPGQGAGARLARLVVALRHFAGRQDHSVLGDRRGLGAGVLDLHPGNRWLAPDPIGRGGRPGPFPGRPMGHGPGRPRKAHDHSLSDGRRGEEGASHRRSRNPGRRLVHARRQASRFDGE